ncbi:3-isopropylmalate dehydratase large subunit [Streptosporangium sp. NPDC004631]
MSGLGMTQKILARHAGRESVRAGEMVVVPVDTSVVLDLNFYDGHWLEPARLAAPDRVVVVYDHVVPAPSRAVADFLERGRAFVRRHGITRFHDVGGDQGICHQLIADVPYARPGEILVCCDSHTCSAGALNCAARGIGEVELTYVLATGSTWFVLGETVRYEFQGALRPGVHAKDVFLHIAHHHGGHVGRNMEFGGPGLASLTMDQRRTVATMCAEVSADFAVFEGDQVLAAHLRARGVEPDFVMPDEDAEYAAVRVLDLAEVEPMVARPHHVVDNTARIQDVRGTRVNRAFIGSCSNGTIEDLRQAAEVLRGRRVHPDVSLLVTPSSQAVYRQAVLDGTVRALIEAGALVTTSSCSMCAGHINALGGGDVCISSSTRNFMGRMGSPQAQIYLASSASVAAAAVTGEIRDPREALAEVPAR